MSFSLSHSFSANSRKFTPNRPKGKNAPLLLGASWSQYALNVSFCLLRTTRFHLAHQQKMEPSLLLLPQTLGPAAKRLEHLHRTDQKRVGCDITGDSRQSSCGHISERYLFRVIGATMRVSVASVGLREFDLNQQFAQLQLITVVECFRLVRGQASAIDEGAVDAGEVF